MSEVKSRPSAPRGRGSGRGGRGGFRSGRGGSRQANGNTTDITEPVPSTEEENGELGELKAKFGSQIVTIKEMFPDWKDEDAAYALLETDGNLEETIGRISEGNISQWGEVKKKTKEKLPPKSKDIPASSVDAPAIQNRGGRGRGASDGARGGRGRGTDRGRATSRGGRAGHPGTNGVRPPKTEATPTVTDTSTWSSPGWDAQNDHTPLEASWENITSESVPTQSSEPSKSTSKPDGTRSWASMFAKPKPAPAAVKAAKAAPVAEAEPVAQSGVAAGQGLPPPIEAEEAPITPPTSDLVSSDVPDLTPPADQLTETNLEQVPDVSNPPPTATAASTAASTIDPSSAGTPLQPFAGKTRPPMGGFATTAWKATNANRSASFQRKVQEQHEAVVMPGKHAIDRATVQFGSMGLGRSTEDGDVDNERVEDAETRTQPPAHSPIAPRASLPSAPIPPQQSPFAAQTQPTETQAAPRQAPGLPPPSHSQQDQPLTSESLANPSSYGYGQFNDRYGTQGTPQTHAQKPFEPFGQQAQAAATEGFQQTQSGSGVSAGNEPASFYTSDNQRNTYQNNLYGNYHPNQDSNSHQGRSGAFASSAAPQSSQYATSQAGQGKFGQENNSGHSTPNPSAPGQPSLSNAPHQMPHGQHGSQHGNYGYGSYPYGYNYQYMNHMNQPNTHVYGRERLQFDDARRYDEQYMPQNAQYGYGGNQGGYGGYSQGGGKHGMYGGQQHQGYGMSPQTSYEHSSSPANSGAFGSQLPSSHRDTATSGTLSSYGRSGSTQPSESQQQFPGSSTGNASSNTADVFGRSASGFQGHSHGLGGSGEESHRGYGEGSKGQGPSPSLSQPGRPGSAANPQGQSGGQAGYGGYPQGSQYGGAPSGQYGGYGGNYGNFYGNSSGRGGWAH